ncbi:MAG: hypothetical protein K6T99_08440 [Armatimonadetes bacterium]|nr:hypothetical protein [Armatimonadota bacterium]
MQKSLAACMAAILLVILLCSQGAAQYEEQPSKISIKVGMFRPSSENLRAGGGSLWKSFGIDYVLAFDEMSKPVTYITLDRTAQDDYALTASIMPITYTRLWRTGTSSSKPFYFGAGVGISFLDIKEYPVHPPFVPADEKKTSFVINGIVGYEFSESFFAELRYMKAGKVADIDFSGMTLYFGVKNLF